VAVDVDGDDVADSWAGPLARWLGCSPFAVTDLNGDGIPELVVTQEFGAVTDYALFSSPVATKGSCPRSDARGIPPVPSW
jgi:hypothetical protein